jgi:hypothetical protein
MATRGEAQAWVCEAQKKIGHLRLAAVDALPLEIKHEVLEFFDALACEFMTLRWREYHTRE